MNTSLPDAPLFCPVCERGVVFIWIWQDPDSARIRMFCEDCAHSDEYRGLPKEQRMIFSYEGFQRFAARRLLTHVVLRERDKKAGVTGEHWD